KKKKKKKTMPIDLFPSMVALGTNNCNDKVIVFAHLPVSCVKGDEKILAWDYDKFRAVVDRFRPCVKMVFAGHDHPGELTFVNGVWYRTLEGAVESDADKDCFATAYFYHDKVFLKGYGTINDELYLFQPNFTAQENFAVPARSLDRLSSTSLHNHVQKHSHLSWSIAMLTVFVCAIAIKFYK
ncbi:manganese-dependent ADP-ribose/CDP-alcohol diphosphatase, partial [Reticulomyxa filosa]